MLPIRRLRLASLSLIAAWSFVACSAAGEARAPNPFPEHPFEPLSAERIATLPASQRDPWQAYWDASQQLAARLPARKTAEFSPLKPMSSVPKGGAHTIGLRLDAPAAWYGTAGAQTLADRVVAWQSRAGAWQKGIDYTVPPASAAPEGGIWISGTFDNDATILELRFLARVIAAAEPTRAARWRESFERGLGYIFAAQYPNGGFPQIYPLAGGYHDAVTFNDDATAHVLALLRDVADGRNDYAPVPPELRRRAAERLALGIECVLATQQRDATGALTIWTQQYDPVTLRPCAARNFEPIAYATQESTQLVLLLMSLPATGPIIASVDRAIDWFRQTAIPNQRWIRIPAEKRGELVPAPGAVVWARLYEPGTTTPIFGDRDRTIHYQLEELSIERRAGYNWYGDWPEEALKRYERWKKEVRR